MSEGGATAAAGNERLKQLEAAFMRLVGNTADDEIKDTLLLNKTTLVKNEVVSAKALQGLTAEQLKAYGLSQAAVAALKEFFKAGAGSVGATGGPGPAGTEPITITIYDPHETPDTTTATFKNAQKFEKFLDRGNITFLYKDGCSPGINDYCDLVPGATYTTAVRSIPARVKNLEQHKEHLVRRREHEFTCAMLDDLASKGVQAVELPEQRVVKAGGADEAEVDVVISHTVPSCAGAVGFVGGAGREGAAHFVRQGFVIGSTKTHVSGDSDARNLGKKIQRQYAQRPPFAGHPIQPAFMPENVKSGQRTRLEDTCREKGIWLYARNGRSISRVQLRAAASARLALV